MTAWKCPECARRFGAVGQGHMCQPGLTEREFLASSPDFVAPVFRRVRDHLVSVDRASDEGTLIVDPLDGKVLFKNGPDRVGRSTWSTIHTVFGAGHGLG